MKKGQKPNCNEKQLRDAVREGMDKTMVFCLTAHPAVTEISVRGIATVAVRRWRT